MRVALAAGKSIGDDTDRLMRVKDALRAGAEVLHLTAAECPEEGANGGNAEHGCEADNVDEYHGSYLASFLKHP